jgi:hypothetical protein
MILDTGRTVHVPSQTLAHELTAQCGGDRELFLGSGECNCVYGVILRGQPPECAEGPGVPCAGGCCETPDDSAAILSCEDTGEGIRVTLGFTHWATSTQSAAVFAGLSDGSTTRLPDDGPWRSVVSGPAASCQDVAFTLPRAVRTYEVQATLAHASTGLMPEGLLLGGETENFELRTFVSATGIYVTLGRTGESVLLDACSDTGGQ